MKIIHPMRIMLMPKKMKKQHQHKLNHLRIMKQMTNQMQKNPTIQWWKSKGLYKAKLIITLFNRPVASMLSTKRTVKYEHVNIFFANKSSFYVLYTQIHTNTHDVIETMHSICLFQNKIVFFCVYLFNFYSIHDSRGKKKKWQKKVRINCIANDTAPFPYGKCMLNLCSFCNYLFRTICAHKR